MGNLLFHSRIESINSLLLTSIGDRNLFLLDGSGDVTPLTQVDAVLSEPSFSSDGQYVSITVQDEGIYQLLILDILQQQVIARFALSGEIPTLLASNRWDSFPYQYGFYYPYGEWHPYRNSLRFVDDGSIYLYDVAANEIKTIPLGDGNHMIFRPVWIC
jgi:hypothetical protein